jgi:hypothetical protein
MKRNTSKAKIATDQKALEHESCYPLPNNNHARKARNFSPWSIIAIVALTAAFGLVMSSCLTAAEPSAAAQDALLTKEYAGNPNLIASLRKASPSNPSATLSEVFESFGVPFPQGTLAQILPGGRMIIRNTKGNMELVDALIEVHSGKAGGSR